MQDSERRDSQTERPEASEYPEFFGPYIQLVPAGDIVQSLRSAGQDLAELLNTVSEQASLYRYEPGKWSAREVVSHVTDLERVFAYRAWWFARGLPGELPGVDEVSAAATAGADARDLTEHLQEFAAVRAASVSLFEGLPAAAWGQTGISAGYRISVRALAHMIIGHQLHHAQILADRYLTQ